MNVQIRAVKRYVYDCFLGVGYSNWSRIRIGHWGATVVGGQKVSKEVAKELYNMVKAHPAGELETLSTEN